jgi:UPF0716 protein FxsA
VLGRLFLLFTLVPLVELFLLIEIGGVVGVLPTIGLIAATGMLGAYLAKREGRRALASYQQALANGKMPEDGIISALLILVGGVLLIAPGVITDVLGLALMIPPIRRGVAKLVMRRVEARIGTGDLRVMHIGPGFGPGCGPTVDAREHVAGHAGVVDVEVVEPDKHS